MLDISIKALDKSITNEKKAADFIRKHVQVIEKIDGTKLTLVRNSELFDPNDYTKNWIVSYKGSVIYPTEFRGLKSREEEIRTSSIGTSQYKFVHDHLRRVHSGTGSIPASTEFFVEFVQNKPTITRDYAKKHGMYLVGFGPTTYVLERGQIYSNAAMVDDEEKLEEYRELLQLGGFPVLFEGNFSSRESAIMGCLDPSLRSAMEAATESIDFSSPMDIVSGLIRVFSTLKSSLGGPAEGVVMRIRGDDMSVSQLYKVLAADQHSKTTRHAKASRYKGTEEEEQQYWKSISEYVEMLLDKVMSNDPEEAMDELSGLVYGDRKIPVKHPTKSQVMIQDDIMLTAKLRLLSTGTKKISRLAVIPMAAKPFHRGHDALIRAAVNDENDLVIVFLSTGGREELTMQDMLPLWRDYYLPGLKKKYGEKVVFKFSDSPMNDAMRTTSDVLSRSNAIATIYGDEEDAPSRAQQFAARDPSLEGRIRAGVVNREGTSGISGTEMRTALIRGKSKDFMNNLPEWMDSRSRQAVWNSLSKKFSELRSENLVRSYIRSFILS